MPFAKRITQVVTLQDAERSRVNEIMNEASSREGVGSDNEVNVLDGRWRRPQFATHWYTTTVLVRD